MFKDGGNTIIELINALIEKNEIPFALKLLEEFQFDQIKSDKINYLKAVCYLKSEIKDYTKALKLLESICPENITSESEYLKHFCNFKTGNYESIVKFHLANEDKFNNFNENLKMIIAIAYEKLNLLQNAKNLYKKIIKSHPNNKEAFNNLSIIEIKHANTQESISYLKKCYKRYPHNLAIANNYALCLIKNKFFEEGLQIFEQILSEFNFRNNKDHLLEDRVRVNYTNNLIKYGKNETVVEYVKNEIQNKGDLNCVKLIVEKYHALNKTEEASELIKKIENELNEGRIKKEEIKKFLRDFQNKKSKIISLNNSLHSKSMSHTEIFKAAEFTIENIELDINKIEKNNVCENKIIVEENNFNNLSFNAKNIEDYQDKQILKEAEKDVDNFMVIPNEDKNANLDINNLAERDETIKESILNISDNKKVIDENYIFDRFHKRKKTKISENSKIMLLNEKKQSKSQEEIFKDILCTYNNNDYNKCRENIIEFRENFAETGFNNLEIACISAKLHYDKKEYSQVINELGKYYQKLDEALLSMLVISSKLTNVNLEYLNFLEEYYRKFHSKEENLLELIVTSVNLYPSSDLRRTEKYVDDFFNLKNSNGNKVINLSDFEKLLSIFLSSSNCLDSALKIIERIKNCVGATPFYYFYLGRYNIKKYNINQAYENFLKIENFMSDKAEYKKYLGKIYIKLGNFGKAIKNLKQALKMDSSDWTSCLSISKCFINLRDFIKAEKYIYFACKINTNSENNIKINFVKGILNYNLKNYESALDYFKICFNLKPKSFKVIHYIALIYIETSEISQAESLLKQILEQVDNFFPSKFELFKIKLIQNKVDDVNSELISEIESNIFNYPIYCMDYADLLLKFYGHHDKAIKYFEIAVKNGKKSIIDQAIKFTEIFNNKKEFTKTIKCYQILLNNCDKDYRIFKGLKDLFSSIKLYDEAIKTINAYIKYNPNSIEANADLGDLYYLKQNYHKSLDFFTRAINLNNINSNNKFNFIKKKIAVCRINLKFHETGYKYLEEYSKMKNEENVYLLMAFLKVLYLDCVEEANNFLKDELQLFPNNHIANNILSGKIDFNQYYMELVMVKLFNDNV